MDLTTTERVRTLLMGGGMDAGTALEASSLAAVAQILVSVSAAAESYLDRNVQSGVSRTEYFDVRCDRMVYPLRAYPVASITGVWYDTTQAFAAATALSSSYYFSPTLDDRGLLRLKSPLQPYYDMAPAALKITYTGGMAATTTAFVAAFPDLAAAVDRQVIYEWKRRNDMGSLSVSGDGGTVTIPEVHLLRSTLEILDRHKRHVHA